MLRRAWRASEAMTPEIDAELRGLVEDPLIQSQFGEAAIANILLDCDGMSAEETLAKCRKYLEYLANVDDD
jgi:hypothetical protein